MNKILSIIIPRFKETKQDIFPLLSSINNQIGIDFSSIEVIISTDGGGGDIFDKEFLNLFKFKTTQIINKKDNVGPGITRQYGLNIAKGEYVMFCDADDILYSVSVINDLVTECEKTKSDVMISSWIEEIIDNENNHTYLNHEMENTWMHGKIIRRQFLIDNNIKFHNDLKIHEDSYFLALAQSFAEEMRFLPITSYVWKYHPGSITRRDNAIYTYSSMPEFIKACSLAYLKIEKEKPEQMEHKIIQFISYLFFTLHLPHWQTKEVKKYLVETEKTFVKWIKPMFHYWKNANPENIAKIYNEERDRIFKNSLENETIQSWFKRLEIY